MRHDWEDILRYPMRLVSYGKRRCRNCGAVQTKEDIQEWGRIIGYRWWPLVGRCKGKQQATPKKKRPNPPVV